MRLTQGRVIYGLLPLWAAAGQTVFAAVAEQAAPAVTTAPTDSPEAEVPASRPAEEQDTDKEKSKESKPKERNYYVASKALGARPEPEPPSYVKTVDKYGFPGTEDLTWLEFGAEHRTRFELRRDDYRLDLENDDKFLLRSRAYIGIREILDPFRFGFEFQDARQFGSNFPETDRDGYETDILQLFGELYFKGALGQGRPLRFQVGRMSFEYVDRRLVGRNRWRNTVNAYDGFRLQLGRQANDWQFDFFAVQPVERRLVRPDRSNEEQWLYGMVGAWRRWSRFITLEPYYFILDQDGKGQTADRELHTMGLHAYGDIGKTGFDYDVDVMFQFGEDNHQDQCAFASFSEVGYTFKHKWKPRLSALVVYATGDRDPRDRKSERFDRLYGVGHPYSMMDIFELRNTISPALRVMLNPLEKLRVESLYRVHWLASDTDAWFGPVPQRRDRTGRSGDFVGQELEISARYQLLKQVELEVGYAHFLPGPFVRNTGPSEDSDFFYVQTTVKLDR